MNRYISLCWEETVRCTRDGQIIQIQYRLSYVTIQGTKRRKSHMTATVINTVLISRACLFLTLYFLQMFNYIYIYIYKHSSIPLWLEWNRNWVSDSQSECKGFFWKDEKSRDQSRQVNNYKANAYKGGITQVHRWYQITWGSEEGRSLMPLGFC